MKLALLVLLIVIVALVGIVFGPLVLIWALNTLFALGIKYTFWTWLASLVLGMHIGGAQYRGGSKK